MTKQEAIDVLTANYPDPCFGNLREAVDMAIESLRGDVPDINDGDMISRQAAIDAMAELQGRAYTKAELKGISKAWKRIKQLPSARPEQRWAPVSERPKKDGRYQVTRLDYVTDTKFIDILWYEKNTWWNRQATGDYAVTAWMPLPKPYGGDLVAQRLENLPTVHLDPSCNEDGCPINY